MGPQSRVDLRILELPGARTHEDFARFQQLAERALLNQGVTFSVYSDARGTEKIFPFCLIPRVISAKDWAHVERGLVRGQLQPGRRLEGHLGPPGALVVIRQGTVRAEVLPPNAPRPSPAEASSMAAELEARSRLRRPPKAPVRVMDVRHRTVYRYQRPWSAAPTCCG